MPADLAVKLTHNQRIFSNSFKELMILFDVFGDSSRHAELLLNKALGRTAEDGNKISARAICATVTALGMKAQEEIYEVLRAYNILYGFDGENLLPGVRLDSSITAHR